MLRVFGYDAIASPRGINRQTILADVTSANVAAGMTAGLFYAFGAVPVHLDAMRSMQLGAGAASSWFFIIFMTSAISSLVLSLKYRMPLPIGWSMPGLIFLATATGHYTHAEIAGPSGPTRPRTSSPLTGPPRRQGRVPGRHPTARARSERASDDPRRPPRRGLRASETVSLATTAPPDDRAPGGASGVDTRSTT